MKTLADKVVSALVKKGYNSSDAVVMVSENIESALLIRPGATPSKLAEVISCIM